MKRSGRTLKQRLYGLKHLGRHLKRARYFRGHGVHSPYIYNIVRQVFMRRTLIGDKHDIYDALMEREIPRRRAIELQNLATHCNYPTFAIDRTEPTALIIATLATPAEELARYAERAREAGATLAITSPYHTAERWGVCRELIDNHPSTTVDNRAYLLIFNNHLPKQRFTL